MRDVSRAVGVSLAGLYHYFASKEQLLYQIQYRTFASLLESQEEVASRPGTPEARVRRLIIGHLAFFAAHPNELKVCAFELDSLQGEFYQATEALRRRYFRVMASAIADLRGGAMLGDIDRRSRHVTLFIFGMLNWSFTWYDERRHGAVDELGEEMLELVMNGLRNTEPEFAHND
jgi:AcrR family transcriptional regulator